MTLGDCAGDESSLDWSQLSREVRSLPEVHQVVERTSLSMVQNQRKRLEFLSPRLSESTLQWFSTLFYTTDPSPNHVLNRWGTPPRSHSTVIIFRYCAASFPLHKSNSSRLPERNRSKIIVATFLNNKKREQESCVLVTGYFKNIFLTCSRIAG